jgi:hypothetical protein
MPLKRLVSVRTSLFVAVLALAAPAFFYGVAASAQSAGAKPVAAVAEEETTPLKNDASHQGIKVHGHWKIVVRNPDGSVAQTREFENSMTSVGGIFLSSILTGNDVSGGLVIYVATQGTSTCGKVFCAMVASTTGGAGGAICSNTSTYACATGLTTTVSSSAASFVLAGQYTASQAGTISQGSTGLTRCNNLNTSQACMAAASNATDGSTNFTNATFTAISVAANQVVQVSVTISFA